MPLPLATLLPPQLKAILGAIQAVPWRLIVEGVMVLVIIFLWNALGDAKEDAGAYKQKWKSSNDALVVCQDEKKKMGEAAQATDKVVGDNKASHAVTDKETQRLLKELREKANARKCPNVGEASDLDNGVPSGINGLDKLLDSATCTASQNGVPCTPGKPSTAL